MIWSTERARVFLEREVRERAANPDTSDRSLAHLSALADPAADESQAAFRRALSAAGWSDRRISRAVETVETTRWTRAAAIARRAADRYRDAPVLVHACIVFLVCFATGAPTLVAVAIAVLAAWALSR